MLLSVYEDDLFENRRRVDIQARVSSLVRRLLTPLTTERLLSHLADLPAYAEAVPDTFLELLETDLGNSEPATFGLMKPVDSGPYGMGQQRTGLLWALEGLGWKHLGHVSRILARLSAIPIDDNWVNRPIASLEALYRSWLPQTSAALDERIRSLRMLVDQYPDAGWRVCMAQLKTGPQFASPSYRPRWRDDASGAGRSLTPEDQRIRFRREAFDFVLSWPDHDHGTLGELVELFHDFGDEERSLVWKLIEKWATATEDDKAKAAVRERIRQHALTHRSRQRGVREEALDQARSAYDRLEPNDPVVRHRWLFSSSWIEPPADKSDESLDHKARRERIDQLRRDAMEEIWRERRFEGVIALLADSGSPYVVGECLKAQIVDAEARADFLNRCLSVTGQLREMVESCVSGFLQAVGDDVLGALLASTAKGDDADRSARLYSLAPVRSHIWRLLDGQSREVRDRYWETVMPDGSWYTGTELTELVDQLLNARRPGKAFFVAHFNWAEIETPRLKRLLLEVGTVSSKPTDRYTPDAHEISNAFDELNGREGIDQDEMARLEFMYFPVLDLSEYGIPNLERRIAESPIDFVRILALVFGERDDDGQDPPEWHIEDPIRRDGLTANACGLLERSSRIPGTRRDGVIEAEELGQWVAETRRLCAEFGRAGVGDHCIGQLLSKAPSGEDGIRPSLVVSKILEAIGSSEIRAGFTTGTFNGRGVTVRTVGEGGKQEGELARQYSSWAMQRSPDFPFVGSILENIAAEYERWARWEDDQAHVGKRLEH